MPTTGFETVSQVVSVAARELGLVSADVADPYAATDPNILILTQLLSTAGRKLVRAFRWNHLRQSWSFTTVANTGRYSMPADFARIINQTEWNRTNRLPLKELSPQQFQFFKSILVGPVLNVLFEELQGQFQAYPDTTTPGAYTLAFEYVSTLWAQPAAQTVAISSTWQPGVPYANNAFSIANGQVFQVSAGGGGTSGKASPNLSSAGNFVDGPLTWAWVKAAGLDAPTAKDDKVLFQSLLISRALKLAWLKEKGKPYQAAQEDYDEVYDQCTSQDGPAPVLSLSDDGMSVPLIGANNLPVTGYDGG